MTTLPLFPPAPPTPPAMPSTATTSRSLLPGNLLAVRGTDIVVYEPSDVDEQHDEWGANCGPTAIAALTNREVKDVRALIERVANGEKSKRCGCSGFWLGHMHAGHITDVLTELHRNPKRQDFKPDEWRWPKKGLAMVQIEGPWCRPPAKPTARFRYTHTVAVIDAGPPVGVLVYDGNVPGWATEKWWRGKVMEWLVGMEKRVMGWYVTTTLEV